INRAAGLAEAELKRKEQRLELAVPQNVLFEMDEVLVLRLLNNLLANAIDATKNRATICVSLEVNPASFNRPGILITVADQGDTTFISLREKPPAKQGGHGLGLRICREIVEQHAGEFQFERRSPTGATVRVFLPQRAKAS
ncbi:MAG: ATP-binding protein, partial [Verrucomicrobiota bacterium]